MIARKLCMRGSISNLTKIWDTMIKTYYAWTSVNRLLKLPRVDTMSPLNFSYRNPRFSPICTDKGYPKVQQPALSDPWLKMLKTLTHPKHHGPTYTGTSLRMETGLTFSPQP